MSALFTDPARRCANCDLRCGVWPGGKCPRCGHDVRGPIEMFIETNVPTSYLHDWGHYE